VLLAAAVIDRAETAASRRAFQQTLESKETR
jgi:hypothetical protein